MSSWPWEWASWAKDLVDNGMLTSKGLAAASLLIIIYFFLNYWTVSLFAKVNSLITIFKIIIPGLTIGALLFVGFHGENFTSHQDFHVSNWSNVLTAMATSGVIFAFNGFQSPINMAGEAKNPGNPFLGSCRIHFNFNYNICIITNCFYRRCKSQYDN